MMTNSNWIEKYPDLFKGRANISIEDGWVPIVDALCATITYYIQTVKYSREFAVNKDDPINWPIPNELDVTVIQVKEKFGGLRFYVSGADDHVNGMIQLATLIAGRTCERCGQPGSTRHGGWIRTLCDHHEKEYQDGRHS